MERLHGGYEKISSNEAYGHEIYDYNELGAEAFY